MVHGMAPEDVRVVGATKGSIVIELAVVYGIAQTISAIILKALHVAERVLDIRKKVEEIRGMRLANDKIARDLEDEAQKEKDKGINEITVQVIQELGKDPEKEGDQVNALDTAVRDLVDFIEKGGEIDCLIPEEKGTGNGEANGDDERGPQVRKLRIAFEEIRALEAKLKQLEHREP
jgi:hypothetical protein